MVLSSAFNHISPLGLLQQPHGNRRWRGKTMFCLNTSFSFYVNLEFLYFPFLSSFFFFLHVNSAERLKEYQYRIFIKGNEIYKFTSLAFQTYLCLSHCLCAYQVVKRKIGTGLLPFHVLVLPYADICHTRRLQSVRRSP